LELFTLNSYRKLIGYYFIETIRTSIKINKHIRATFPHENTAHVVAYNVYTMSDVQVYGEDKTWLSVSCIQVLICNQSEEKFLD